MQKPPATLTIYEQHALLAALGSHTDTPIQKRKSARNYLIAMLMLEAGLRVGEVVNHNWEMMFFNNEPATSIIIPPEISKNGLERAIPVSTRLCMALKVYQTAQKDANLTLGCWITARQVERIICAAGLKALGRRVHPHMLRHTFATKLMRRTNIRVVQQLLGHRALSSTQVYTHPNGDDLKKAIDTLDTETDGDKL